MRAGGGRTKICVFFLAFLIYNVTHRCRDKGGGEVDFKNTDRPGERSSRLPQQHHAHFPRARGGTTKSDLSTPALLKPHQRLYHDEYDLNPNV